jgi:two-component system, chemotaxis family, sensor histidine kinase and response regulator WspE
LSAALPSGDVSMLDLYRLEAQDQSQILTTHLLALERAPTAPDHLEACMRAAHSLKGAARIVGFEQGVKLAHAMEDYFVAAQRGTLLLGQERIDSFLRDIDILRSPPDPDAPPPSAQDGLAAATESVRVHGAPVTAPAPEEEATDRDDRMLRVTADHLTRLLRLAGESLVEARRRKHGEEHAHRLYEAALACRMRPFADGTQGFPRMVRDIARSLNKQVRLEVRGTSTQVDRDILARLEAPLGHLLRNAVDHGVEAPEERRASGKSEEAVITLEARHNSGTLQVSVSDDGRGISLERIRESVIRRGLSTRETAARLTEAELLEFLFLPGFTLKDDVTEVSGRGVGLDVVQDVLKKVRGAVRVTSEAGRGTRFLLQLPLTLSVERTLLVEIANEPYALPLAQIASTARIERTRIEYLEGRPHYHDGKRNIGLVGARQLLRGEPADLSEEMLNVVLLGTADRLCALLVDSFLGERELVVQPLDPRLGKVKDVAAAAVMEDGAPVLILDVEDLIRSVEKIASEGPRAVASASVALASIPNQRRRVLVVDDSLTVREIERKLLTARGYQVDVATDGMDGWNAIRTGKYDLLVTDVDMPRMDGIELVKCVRNDPHLKSLPVMIVSYKDRPEDRRRGLDAGADHYLAKSSFHDEALLEAVRDLIGEAVSASLSSVA